MVHSAAALLTLILTLWSAPAQAAVAIDGTVSTNKAFSVPVSVVHNGGTGANRLTIACVALDTAGSASNTAASYNGVSMTEWGRQSSDSKEVVLWYLVNSATGSNTLATTIVNLSAEQTLTVVTFTGVHQSTPVRTGTAATANGTSTTASVAATSLTSDMVVDCVGVWDGDTFDVTGTVGAGQSQAAQHRSDFYVLNLVSTEVAVTTSTTMSWTLNQSEPWSSIAGALIPAVSTARRKVGPLWLGK